MQVYTSTTVTIDCGCGKTCQSQQPIRLIPHFGVPRPTTPEQRSIPGTAHHFEHLRIGAIVDIAVDQELPIEAPTFTDELRNPVPAPADFTQVATTDNPDAVIITTADDGVEVARSAGNLSDDGAGGGVGPANIHVVATWTDTGGESHTATGDAQLVVVAGNAERLIVNFGAPREITPDAPAVPTP